MKVCCVIVNYNDGDTVMNLVDRITGFKVLEGIVVVDNRSTDDSLEKLRSLEGDKVTVIRGERNGGYGYGNNLGVQYAVKVMGATHVAIANPDVEFTERTILALGRLFQKHPDLGAAAPVMEDMQYGGLGRGWRLHGFLGELLVMGPVSRRLFRRFLNYPEQYYRGKRVVGVGAVHGSMLMVDGKAFLECGGYDEGIFLYQEESVLGWRMRTGGYRTAVLMTETYVHRHGTSIIKSCESQMRRQMIRHESVLYYMKHYLYINRFQQLAAKVWFGGILAEIWLAGAGKAVFGDVRKGPGRVLRGRQETGRPV